MPAAWKFLLWAVLASPALAGEADSAASRLRITATPGALTLAEGLRSTLRITGASQPPVLAASVGSIDVRREVSSGVYEAEYVPPDTLDPQIAFVTALSADGFAWAPIALSGVREVAVMTRRGTPVTISVAEELFGPIPADGAGRALVRVVVPPGVRTARYGKQRMDLGVQSTSLVHVLLSTSKAEANAGADLTVRAFAVTEDGRPRRAAPVTLSASTGTLSPAVEVEPGVFAAHWRVERSQVGEAQVTARLRDRPESLASATLERTPGAPRRIAIRVDRAQIVAGDGKELAVTAEVLDAAGNTTECPTNLVVDPGMVLEWERTGRGRYAGRVQAPTWRAGRQQLELKVVASQALSGSRVIPLIAGPAEQIRIEAAGELYADSRPHELQLAILDREGNHVDVADAPVVTASRGAVGRAVRRSPGAFRVEYRARLSGDDFEDLVRARAGSLEGTARIRVRALGAGLVIAPKAGFTLGSGRLRSPSGGVEVGVWTGYGLGLVAEGQYYALHRRDTVGGLSLQSDATYLALVGSVAWRRPLGGWLLWLGAGGGAVNADSRVSGIAGQAAVPGKYWAALAQASVGLGRPLGPGVPFGELRIAWQADPGRGPVRGSMESLTFQVGYRFDVL